MWKFIKYKKIDKYFKNTGNDKIPVMVGIINKDSKISLRMLDWFVTKYTKINSKKVTYKLNDDNPFFNIGISYKAQLSTYTKKYFDPFRRRKKFDYYYVHKGQAKRLKTTIGQLNFFKWIFEKKILEYIYKYYDELAVAMKASNKEEKKKKKEKSKKKNVVKQKKELNNNINKNVVNIKKNGIDIKAKQRKKDKKVSVVISFE